MINIPNFNKKFICGFVGSGLSSMLLINEFLKNKDISKNAIFHIFEKNPLPFGLIRNGISPDNYKLKENLIENFTTNILKKSNINYYGNVLINNKSLQILYPYYSLFFLGTGLQQKKLLNIKNENLILEGIDIANWYNGGIIKESKHIENIFSKNKLKNLVIFGNGKVSIDLIKILFLINENFLYKYGVPVNRIKYIKQLRKKIKNIYIVCKNLNNVDKLTNLLKNEMDNNNLSNNLKLKFVFLFDYIPVSFDGVNLYIKNNQSKQCIKTNVIIKSIGRNNDNLVNKIDNKIIDKIVELPKYKNINEAFLSSSKLFEQLMDNIDISKLSINSDINYSDLIKKIQTSKRIITKNDWFKINEYEKNEGKKKGKVRELITGYNEIFKLL